MNKQNKRYQQLTLEQRYPIAAQLEIGMSHSHIAKKLGKHRSSIVRKVGRNSYQGNYKPELAQQLSDTRRRREEKASKRDEHSDRIICDFLSLRWSPESISERMKVECESSYELSHSTIYKRIEDDKRLGGRLYRQLPRFGKSRWKGGKRKRHAGAKLIPNRIDITERPAVVETRTRLCDWEGDLMHGQESELITLVDRVSRFTLAKRVFNKTKREVADMIISMLNSIKQKCTLTLDNGGEFAEHCRISESTGVDVYFSKPQASDSKNCLSYAPPSNQFIGCRIESIFCLLSLVKLVRSHKVDNGY